MPRKTLAYFLAISSQPLAISISSSKFSFLIKVNCSTTSAELIRDPENY